ncbi:proline--tRNA ligase [Oleisolibacter albus]|uniref:proline--tRNA ligase n=1 Tax=Oleisolibacter albus TaxID=2171757 RepID=UPI000DF2191A|nr:proline--tRNA ligase [Oleisolibacter albus]
MENALPVTRRQNFPQWYQTVVDQADLAEESGVRGCMVIKPWGWGIWERIQQQLDRMIKETGHENCYFPLLIPLSYFQKEAEHVDGFAKEMAVVTHHRLKAIDGKLQPDPEAALEEPLVIRPTSETIIGSAMQRWVKSYRDLPVMLNQWANVMRWEMRTRMFLRTAEFLWQEGHTAHAGRDEAMEETMRMLEVYRILAEDVLAMPVVAGEKPPHERFPGADNTFSIEAMMQDGKALQAGTSHYLGTHFAQAQDIRYQDENGGLVHAHTTSWGVSTRLIGGVIMTHGDDDGLQLPPRIAPHQVVIVPMLRDKPEDADVLAYCQDLAKALRQVSAFGEPVRAHVDVRKTKAVNKRWAWVKRGAPIVCEIGPRDVTGGNVSFLRRDALRGEKGMNMQARTREAFLADIAGLLTGIQQSLFDRAKSFLDANITGGIDSLDALTTYFAEAGEEESFRGWVRVAWAKPEGEELARIEQTLKALKLTVRNAPLVQPPSLGSCIFTCRPAVEEIIVGRAY